ncbi:hypothetical protein [Streptomyces sp. NPDC007074]|uniref:hypothetical protein n=1 Tax=Streptomyces sp. NPDC007074 TaxID=3156764 RepID=UPI003407EA97
MGRETDDDAASRLHLLDTYYRQHPSTGPTERRSPSVSTAAPLNLDMVDYIDRCVDEVVQHTRAEAPKPTGPVPSRVAEIYDWYREHTEDAGPEVQQQRDIVIVRQRLEHGIRMGDYNVVCPHPCPRCTTWGLQWQQYRQRAVCLNVECRGRDGMASSWTLGRLATQYVMKKEILRIRAT